MKAKLQALWTTFTAQLADIWNRSKIFLLAIGALVVAFEFRKLKDMALVYLANKQMQTTKKEDASLATQESNDSAQADALVKQAQALPDQQQAVKPDWYKKDQT